MSIIINNGVQNINGTPGAISGVFSDLPSATGVADGTLYFSTDTAAIYQAVGGSWILYTGGGGGGTSTGVNGLNGTTNIGLGGTLANSTTILGAGFDLTINNAGKLIMDAAYWNFSNNNAVDTFKADSVQTFIGCETQVGLGVSFVFDRTNKKIESFYNGSSKGFLLDYNNQTYKIGDTNYLSFVNGLSGIRSFINNVEKGILIYGDRVILGDWDNGTLNFNVEIDTGTVYTNYSSQGTNGFILDFVLGQYKLGDYQNQVGGSALLIDAPNGNINTFYNDTQIGIKLDFANNAYTFGSVLAAGSNFVIDNFNGNVYITNSINQFTGFNFDMIGQIYQFGDLPGGNKITFDNNGEIKIDANNLFRSYYSNQINGISIDFVNSFYIFGAVENGQGTQLYLNDTFNVSYFLNTANGSSGAQGLYLEFATGRYVFGDVSSVVSGQTLEINSNDEATIFTYAGNTNGISLQFVDNEFRFGDLTNSLAYININASQNKIFFVSTDGLYNIANIPAYTDNADALANGLVVGDLYRHNGAAESADQLRIVH